jgi:hypothetical protein
MEEALRQQPSWCHTPTPRSVPPPLSSPSESPLPCLPQAKKVLHFHPLLSHGNSRGWARWIHNKNQKNDIFFLFSLEFWLFFLRVLQRDVFGVTVISNVSLRHLFC